MKQPPDAIYILTLSSARAEALKQAIVLRGFDEIVCAALPNFWESNPAVLSGNTQPALMIVDAEGDAVSLLAFMRKMPVGIKSLVLSDGFEESVFLACHDAGARDFMVKPVPNAYLLSRVISTLQEHRREQLARQKDQILEELGVISVRSGVLTTSYLLKQLETISKTAMPQEPDSLAILMVSLEGLQGGRLHASQSNALYAIVGALLKESARGLDWVGEYFVDKFVLVLPQTGKRGASALGRRVLERLKAISISGQGEALSLTVRMGMADYGGCRHYEDLLNQALSQLQADPGLVIVPLKSI